MLDVRGDFPFLERAVNGRPIIYFDNAATTQKPQQVVSRVVHLYTSGVSNVHRAVNFLAAEVTELFEMGRETVARFIGAQAREVVFVNNATQGINFVCSALQKDRPLRILTTALEHHSNLLPWMRQGTVEFAPWAADGCIDREAFAERLRSKPDLVAIARTSNFLGTVHPVRDIIRTCRRAGVPVLLDASQSIAHERHDVRELDCDYLVFSGHKIYGPSGIGVLYVRNDVIEEMKPVLVGGSMVKEVHTDTYVLNDIPYRFEAGTPNIEGVVGLAAALEYFSRLGQDAVAAHESELTRYAKCRLARLPRLTMYGPLPGEPSGPLVAFRIEGLESPAVAKVLANRANVIVRSGFHCAQPAHEALGTGPTVRASFAIYNTREEVDSMIGVLEALVRLLN